MSAVPHYFVFENQRPLTSQAHGGLLAVDPFTQEVRHSQAHVLSGWAPDVVNEFLQCKFALSLFLGESYKDPALDLLLPPLDYGSPAHRASLQLVDYFHLCFSHRALERLLRIICTVASHDSFAAEIHVQARRFRPSFRRALNQKVFFVKALLPCAYRLNCMPRTMRLLYQENNMEAWSGEDQRRIRADINNLNLLQFRALVWITWLWHNKLVNVVLEKKIVASILKGLYHILRSIFNMLKKPANMPALIIR